MLFNNGETLLGAGLVEAITTGEAIAVITMESSTVSKQSNPKGQLGRTSQLQ